MKKKWYANFELFKFSLIILLIGDLLIGLSNVNASSSFVVSFLQALGYCGVLFKKLFPVAFAINYIAVKHESGVASFVAFISFLVLEVTTMFCASSDIPEYYFSSVFNISITNSTGISVTKSPLTLGLIGSIIVIVVVDGLYKITNKRYNYGYLTFLDNDAVLFISSIIVTAIAGVIISLLAPYVVNIIDNSIEYVSTHSSNPACMAIYGILDKTFDLLQMPNIIRNNFWYGSLGGSYIDTTATTYYGDINIWTYQINNDLLADTTGKYISARYILNIFITPALVIGYYFNIKDKMDRNRVLGLAILAIIVSLFSGSSMSLEYLLIFIAPTLFVFHIGLSSIIYMLVAISSLNLGYELTTAIEYANVGNLVDYINYSRLAAFNEITIRMALIGAVGFVLYQLIILIYYNVLAQDFLEPKERKVHIEEIVNCCGGKENIKMVTSTATDVVVVVFDKSKVQVAGILNTSVFKVKERYFGYYLLAGPGSHAIAKNIKRLLKG